VSLPEFSPQMDLFGIQHHREILFKEGDRYRLFSEKIYPLLVKARERLEGCYCLENGRPGKEPVVLLGVSLLQFLERLPDRQAAEQMRYHVGWKYALNQELGDETFDSTVLVRFRERLLGHEEGRLVFEVVQEALMEAGLMPQRGRQRMDSTHVLGLVKRMSDLDCIRESVRMALEELDIETFRRPEFWPRLWERYVETRVDYRSTSKKLQEKLVEAGQDAWLLLQWMDGQKKTNKPFGQGPKSALLAQIFKERFDVSPGGVTEKQTVATAHVENPHDPDAQYRKKGDKAWVGYVTQVAETVPEKPMAAGEPTTSFITSIVTQQALGSDQAGMKQALEEQAQMGLERPSELYVDAAYVTTKTLLVAEQEQRALMGPAVPARGGKAADLTIEDFDVNIAARQAICPAGHRSTQCSRIEDRWNGITEYRFEWSWRCKGCELRKRCLSSTQVHRTIRVTANHMILQARRREMKTTDFQEKMKRRRAIEGTLSELIRGYDIRHARYRGLTKVQLQNYFIGAACNVKRWFTRLAWEMKQRELSIQPS
jgi:transposase